MATTKKNPEQELNLAEQLLKSSVAEGADGESLSITDRLSKMFDADDLVEVRNFTKKPIGWVYSDKKDLTIEQPNEFTRRVTQGSPKVRVLQAGKTLVIPGWEAYVGLTRFYKDWVQAQDDENLLMNSPTNQNAFIAQAFVGIYDPNGGEEPSEDVKSEVEKDLGLTNAKKSK